MSVERFSSAKTPCDVVYCDANFVMDLAVAASAVLKTHLKSHRRADEAKDFFARYSRDHGTAFISSPLALEEVVHKFSTTALRNTKTWQDWKSYRTHDRAAFDVTRAALLSVVAEFQRAIGTYALHYVLPKTTGVSTITSNAKDICNMAVRFHRVYDSLDAMDAFHVAMALASGATWIASSDAAMQTVAEISVFTG